MMRFAGFLLLMLVPLLAAGPAVALERSCEVKYLSADHVYLSAGMAEGLSAGATVKVVRDEMEVAVLEVLFTARHSASCRVVSSSGDILPGDTVVFEAPEEVAAEPAAPVADQATARRVRQFPARQSRPVARPGSRTSGTVALQWDHSDEDADRALSSDLLSVPFRLRVDALPGGAELRARGTFRHISRSGYSASTPTGEWRNRIRQVAVVRDDRRQAWHYAVGRITVRQAASTGPVDGASVDYPVREGLRLGAFGGFVPDWGTLDFSTDSKVAGAGLQYQRRRPDGRRLDVMLAGVGRYTAGEVSREYLALTTTWADGRRLSLLQAAEVDYNRDWRKQEGQSTLELTSLALTGRLVLNRRLNLDLGYDDRQPVRTWESRALPDSLFTDAGRTGWRGGLSWRDAAGRSLRLRASLREGTAGRGRTTGWQGGVYLPGLTGARLDLNLAFRGFDGPDLSGWSPTLKVRRRLAGGAVLAVEGGLQSYNDKGDLSGRDSSWLGLSAEKDLGRKLSAWLELRRDWGEDMAGNRLFLELRRRL